MISCNNGEIVISGEMPVVHLELSAICHRLKSIFSEQYGEEKAVEALRADLERGLDFPGTPEAALHLAKTLCSLSATIDRILEENKEEKND